jgi:hypothetical protein
LTDQSEKSLFYQILSTELQNHLQVCWKTSQMESCVCTHTHTHTHTHSVIL